MSNTLTERVEELERRVRDLEARPIVLPIFIQPQPYVPALSPHYVSPPCPWSNPAPCPPTYPDFSLDPPYRVTC